ncbi:MAG: hypothetical protein WD154_00950 [Nitrosopumilaceae archaeon]
MATEIEVEENLQITPKVERVNTTDSIVLANEDRNKVRSDMGNKMVQKQQYITTAKKQKETKIRQETKKERLLADQDLSRWYVNLARGSPLTAEVRLRRISQFCEVNNITSAKFAKLGQKNLRKVTDLIEDHISWMEQKKYSPGYIDSTLSALKSWLRHFDVEIKRKIKIRYSDSTPTLEGERVPNKEEMTEVFNRAPLRTTAIIALVSKTGLRLQVLGNFDATDGLTLADIPDIAIQDSKAVCLKRPPMIVVRKTLSKTRHQYFTFLTENGKNKLLAYLNDRIARGEILGPDSAVIAPDTNYKTYRGTNKGKKFIPTAKISKDIRKMLRPRFGWRPYIFRAYFDTQLLVAEARGKMAHDFRVFFMGHKGSMESKYTTNKGILPDELVKEMREAFMRSEELLDLELQTEAIQNTENKMQQPAQMVVAIEKVEELMSQGWKFLATLSKNRAVVEKNWCQNGACL